MSAILNNPNFTLVFKMHKVPSEKDWGNYKENFDSLYAYEMFFGKTNDDMQESFQVNVIERVDNLRWMPGKAFQYYIFGLKDYVMNGAFDFSDEADASSCFLDLIIEKQENQSDYIYPVLQDLMEAIEYIGNHQSEFDADENIYGSFKGKLERIKELEKTYKQ